MSVITLKQTIASLYKRKSKTVMDPKEMELLASMELRWFQPNEVRKLVEIALVNGILEHTDDGLKPNFDLNKIEIPFGFRPPKKLLNELESDQDSLFMQIVNKICLSTGLDENQVIGDINKKQLDLNEYITLDTAAILFAEEHEVDVKDLTKAVKDKLLT